MAFIAINVKWLLPRRLRIVVVPTVVAFCTRHNAIVAIAILPATLMIFSKRMYDRAHAVPEACRTACPPLAKPFTVLTSIHEESAPPSTDRSSGHCRPADHGAYKFRPKGRLVTVVPFAGVDEAVESPKR